MPDTDIEECPQSLIPARAMELVQIFNRARHGHENSGAALFGGDLSKWPAWAVDAMVVIEQASISEQNARFEAERHE